MIQECGRVILGLPLYNIHAQSKTDLRMAMIRPSREVGRCARMVLGELSWLLVLREGGLPARTGYMGTDCLFSWSVDDDQGT